MLELAALLASLASAPAREATTVPFHLSDHRIFVNAYVEGAGPFAMIVDTGSWRLTVTPGVLQRIAKAAKLTGYVTGAGNGRAAAGVTTLRDLSIGSLHYGPTAADVVDLSPLARAIGFRRLDGIIGYAQLQRYHMFVDMDGRTLTLSPSDPKIPAASTSTPFTLRGGLMQVGAAVDGVAGTFILDTGDRSQLTLFRAFAAANDVYAFAPVRNVVTGYGIGGPIRSDLLLTTLQAFGTTAAHVRTRASLDRGGAFVTLPQAGSIGNGFMERFNAVYDFPDRRIVTWPVRVPVATTSLIAEPPIPQPSPNGTLRRHALFGAAAAQKNGVATVTFVAPNGPAAMAGLKAGDVLESIDGRAIVTAADYYDAAHDARPGVPVRVAIRRNGATLVLTLTPGSAPDERDAGLTTQYNSVAVDDTPRRTILTAPAAATGRLPALLLIGGIGCYSVDAAANAQDPYLRIAHDVARVGFVTMRVEKSGIGDSAGPPCRNVDFDAEVRGYEAAFAALAADPAVDASRIYLFGHSIGTVIAPRLALEHGAAGIIVAEAVGRDWPEYEIRNTRRQLELGGAAPADVDAALVEKSECLQKLLFEYAPESQIEAELPSCKVHNGVYPVPAAYMQQVARLNIVEPWTQLAIPALAIYGTADFVTEIADHQRIVDIVNAGKPGTATLVQVDGMSHMLQVTGTAKAALDAYGTGKLLPYDDELSRAVITWLCARETCAAQRVDARSAYFG